MAEAAESSPAVAVLAGLNLCACRGWSLPNGIQVMGYRQRRVGAGNATLTIAEYDIEQRLLVLRFVLIYGQDRVVTGNASGEITHSHGEERTVVLHCCRWSRIGRLSRSSNVHAILRPLIVQWRCACRRHAEAGFLSCFDRLIGWLCGVVWRVFFCL